MKNSIKLVTSLMFLAVIVGTVPVAVLAKNDNNNGKGNRKDRDSESVTVQTISGTQVMNDDDGDDDKGNTKEKDKNKVQVEGNKVQVMNNGVQVNGEKKGIWARILALFSFGAGKSGKVPPGLLHAPGIQKKIAGMSTTTVSVFPGISQISVSNVASTSVKISWKTNKPTTDVLYFGTSTPVGTSNSSAVLSSNQNMTHMTTITGLTASTAYYYKIVATDYTGKVSSTTDLTFTTASGVVADTIAPVISNVVATTTLVNASTTGPVHVTWTTNEPATSKIWFGTSTPVVSGTSTQMITSAILVTNHDVTLPTLFASSTYYMMVSSSDAAGNTASSAEFTFTVLP